MSLFYSTLFSSRARLQNRLLAACTKGDLNEVISALEKGAEVNTIKPLIVAAHSGYANVCQLLLDKGADIKLKMDEDNSTPLMAAAMGGSSQVTKLFLDRGAEVDAISSEGFSSLRLAAAGGHEEIVQQLLAKNADLHPKRAIDGTTAVMAATENGHERIAVSLLEKGARLDEKTLQGATLLMLACKSGKLGMVKYLLARKADINALCNGTSVPFYAADGGSVAVMKHLVGLDVDLTHTLPNGLSLLFMAATKGRTEMCQYLIEQGADVNAPFPQDKSTPLMCAAMNGHVDTVAILLESGADINAVTQSNVNALILAAQGGHVAVMRLLLSRGVTFHRAQAGLTIQYAVKSKRYEAVEFAAKKFSEVNAREGSGVDYYWREFGILFLIFSSRMMRRLGTWQA